MRGCRPPNRESVQLSPLTDGSKRLAWTVPVIVGVVALVVYARTLLPGIAFGDWGEMQTIPHVLGVAHPTGYPTYIMLAWLAEHVPIGSVAFRANLLLAVFVSAALGTLTLISIRLGVRPVIAGAQRSPWVPSARCGPPRRWPRSTRSICCLPP